MAMCRRKAPRCSSGATRPIPPSAASIGPWTSPCPRGLNGIEPGHPMATRREFLELVGAAGAGLALTGCAASPALRRLALPGMEGDEPPYLGLARSLTVEHDTLTRVEGTLPPELRGTLYRNGPG